MKEEALKLADELEALHQYVPSEAPIMIRRLVEELDKQGEPVAWMLTLPDGTHDWILDGNGCEGYIPLYTTPQTKPLSDEEIVNILENNTTLSAWIAINPVLNVEAQRQSARLRVIDFARAIEERHGIK